MNRQSFHSPFIERISHAALQSKAVNHPYLQRLKCGDLPNMELAIRDFAFQYGVYSSGFINYLTAVVNQLNNPKHQIILRENLAEEKGKCHEVKLPQDVLTQIEGLPHTKLFQRFQDAAGANSQFRQSNQPNQVAVLWRQQFLSLCESDECVGVGAIGIGTELIVSNIYNQILIGLKTYGRISPEDRVFFDLHSECDEEHAVQLISIAEDLSQLPNNCEKIEFGVNMAISMRSLFWDKMLERALNFETQFESMQERTSVV